MEKLDYKKEYYRSLKLTYYECTYSTYEISQIKGTEMCYDNNIESRKYQGIDKVNKIYSNSICEIALLTKRSLSSIKKKVDSPVKIEIDEETGFIKDREDDFIIIKKTDDVYSVFRIINNIYPDKKVELDEAITWYHDNYTNGDNLNKTNLLNKLLFIQQNII